VAVDAVEEVEVDAVEVDAVEVDAVEVDAVEVDAVEVDAVEVDAVEVDAVEVDAVEEVVVDAVASVLKNLLKNLTKVTRQREQNNLGCLVLRGWKKNLYIATKKVTMSQRRKKNKFLNLQI
jgi:hypothetical protein